MRRIIVITALVLAAAPASAQLLPGGIGGLTGGLTSGLPLPGGLPGGLTGAGQAGAIAGEPLGALGGFAGREIPAARELLDLRRLRLRTLVRDNDKALDVDTERNPVRRGELIAIDLDAAQTEKVSAAGFTLLRADSDTGVPTTILRPPAKMPLKRGLAALRALLPEASFDYNHVYEPAGAALQTGGTARAGTAVGGVIGLIDGGVAAHSSLTKANIEQRGFAGPVTATGHGTAIASLLVGQADRFTGAALGASLLVADVYGGSAANGSAEAIARALAWLDARGVRIVNISLVGPPNILVERAIAASRKHGMLVVAAVGNDGPAAPPLYPASYDGVIAVTGVDGRERALAEAGRASHLDFAAPGADLAAAIPAGGFALVRGTSFAAPLVAARLAVMPGGIAAVSAEARPARAGKVGRGIVCGDCRNNDPVLLKKVRR
ncbi:hypothetical protein GCM10011529_24860 [Polymorphobacter glacialis]|uniref:Peptidase S8/S53 domain-containing protein n=1 Tax=Sandarakinorhabdus glacialis TaxID=1614636 RepID=A0A917E9J3_9SPHN|nr:S8 family serine peptidase [Polymorphobacter glacialis]GGE17365.1 hypothetical protein GCM10011529_24860 [Polymorphobacter glacialis]